MNKFKPSLESLEGRWVPDGPRLIDPITGLPVQEKQVPEGSPIITIDVLVIQWVTARVGGEQ